MDRTIDTPPQRAADPAIEPAVCVGEACDCDLQPIHERAVPLTAMARGERGVVCETCLGSDDSAMLRAMGVRPRAQIQVCRLGEPCIVEVACGCGGRCRIGLSRALAQRLMIGRIARA